MNLENMLIEGRQRGPHIVQFHLHKIPKSIETKEISVYHRLGKAEVGTDCSWAWGSFGDDEIS